MMGTTDEKKEVVATKQVIVFLLGSEEYAVPIHQVREVVKAPDVTQVPGGQDFIIGVINLRGKILPVVDLEKLFGLESTSQQAVNYVLITEDTKAALFGVRVDHVSQVLNVPETSIKAAPSVVSMRISADYIQGVIIQSSKDQSEAERMLLLLDMQKIVAEKTVKDKESDLESAKEVVEPPSQNNNESHPNTVAQSLPNTVG